MLIVSQSRSAATSQVRQWEDLFGGESVVNDFQIRGKVKIDSIPTLGYYYLFEVGDGTINNRTAFLVDTLGRLYAYKRDASSDLFFLNLGTVTAGEIFSFGGKYSSVSGFAGSLNGGTDLTSANTDDLSLPVYAQIGSQKSGGFHLTNGNILSIEAAKNSDVAEDWYKS